MREVHQNMRLQIKRDHGDPVVRAQVLGKAIRQILRIICEDSAKSRAELHEQHNRYGGVLFGSNLYAVLRLIVIKMCNSCLL